MFKWSLVEYALKFICLDVLTSEKFLLLAVFVKQLEIPQSGFRRLFYDLQIKSVELLKRTHELHGPM